MENRSAFSEEIDLHELFFKLRRRWAWFVGCLLLAGLGAWLYLAVKSPVYDYQSTMLIGDQSTGSKQTQELLQLLDNNKQRAVKIEDEVGLLTSADMVRRTLEQLPFGVSYYAVPDSWLNSVRKLKVRERAMGGVPFQVQALANKPQLTGVPIYVESLADGRFRVHAEADKGELRQLFSGELVREVEDVKFDQTIGAGDTLRTPLLSVVINPEPGYPATGSEQYFFRMNDMSSLTADYQQRLKVQPTEHESRILLLSIRGSVPDKEQRFLNTLMTTYVQDDLNQKNETGRKTIAFLDNEIGKLSNSRSRSTANLSSFRASRNVVDVGVQSGVDIQQQAQLGTMRARVATDQKFYESMLSYLRQHRGKSQVATLSSAGISDPTVTHLIEQLTELNNKRAVLAVNASDINPQVVALDEEISTTKEQLIQTLGSLTRTSEIALRDLDQQLSAVRSQLSSTPENERQLNSLQTTSESTEKNYSFLVQKRNEAAIALATNTTDKKIVDPARQTGLGPAAPKPPLVALLALLAGLAIPTGLVLLIDKTNRRVQGKEDLARITDIPLLGVIPHGTSKDRRVQTQDPRSPIVEAFRSIRVNLQYLSAGLDKRVIGVTSSVPGEGKTFCSVHLAAELARSGRRVILLECDMRRPAVAPYLGIDARAPQGLSTYLSGQSTLEEARIVTDIPNLDVLACGPIPHNPTELLESKRLEDLILLLKEEYDYLMVDIPPMGYVSEFFVLLQHLDANLYVVRQNYTDREMVGQIDELYRDQKVKQLYTVINDVHFANTYEYRYKTKAYNYGS
ncbi:polysaccharide biosynthesis tyrosine autokinase [Hymenobacter profundi]|uniref:non-specific protein-tyrosine kinase n=1 Tax=Hymenobacter profundi TaxID=1982110 RepID=A0ABS6X2P4_9BACT|nr:tyrosine-protein kinase [Hymenobacter profundi]MBW3129566.1 polysaccharide biosynthesis tyrosine autokinase [Hymenobacter profundi]